VGKRAVALSAGQALGMIVVIYNCHELAASGGGAEGKIAAVLATAFESAQAYAPAILVLRRFGALCAAGAPVAATPDAGAANTPKPLPLLAKAIERLVRQHGLGAVHSAASAPGGGEDGESEDEAPPPQEPAQPEAPGEPPKLKVWHRGTSAAGAQQPGLVLLMAAVESADSLPPDVRRCFTHELDVLPPDEPQRAALLRDALGAFGGDVDVEAAAAATAGLMPRDLRALVADAAQTAVSRAAAAGAAPALGDDDVAGALKRAGMRTSAAIGAPKVPDVTWDDVGGLEDAKSAILDTVQLPLRHRALFSTGGRRRSGALLYGPPGASRLLVLGSSCLTLLPLQAPARRCWPRLWPPSVACASWR
jgi:peroxin-6